MKSYKIVLLFISLMVLLCNTSCISSTRRIDSRYKKENIKCKVLSRVAISFLPTSDGPLIISTVKIQILEPEHLRGTVTDLKLQTNILMKYTGHINGETWHDIDSIQYITVLMNAENMNMGLYPPAKGSWRKLKGSGISFWSVSIK